MQITSNPPAPIAVTAPVVAPRTKLLLEAPILRTIIQLAAPNIVVVFVQVASSTVDGFFLGRLGPDVLAGVALVFPVWMFMVTMSAGGVGGGIASAVARALGGGRRADANALVTHALVICVLCAAAFSFGVVGFGPRLYAALGGSNASLDAAVTYSSIVFAGALAVWLVSTLSSLLRGAGEMTFPAVVVVAGEILHVVLAPTLIFGLGPFPALGVAGAGISLVTSYTLRALAFAVYLLAGRSALRVPTGQLRLRWSLFWDILRVGLPGAANTLLTNVNVLALTGLVGSFGTFALAGYGLGARLEYLQIPLVFGLGTALVTIVGTNVGAGQIERARRAAWVGGGLAAGVTGTVGIAAALAPQVWIGTFTAEPAVLATGETYLRIVGPTYALFGFGLALYFASQGAGHLTWPLIAGVVRLILAVGGGWLAIRVFGADLSVLFFFVAGSFVLFAASQATALRFAIRSRLGNT